MTSGKYGKHDSSFVHVRADKVRVGDRTIYMRLPGVLLEEIAVCSKAISLPSGQVEIAWCDAESGRQVFEGLYEADSLLLLSR